MKKVLLILLVLVSILNCIKKDEAKEINFIFPEGLPTVAILELYADNKQFDDKIEIKYEKTQTVDALTANLMSKDNVIAIVPSNMAAQLYNKKLDYRILGTISWGSLYLVSSDNVNSISDLNNKKIGVIGRGQTPDIVFKNILSKNGINPDNLDIEYYSSSTELSNALAANIIKTAVVSEPNVSILLSKNKDIKIILSLNEEWKRLYSSDLGFPQATLIAKKNILDDNPDFIKKLIKELEKQNEWIGNNMNKEEYLKKANMSIPENLILDIVKNSNILFMPISETKNEYKNYYETLSDFDPKTVGEKVPDDEIFYEK